MDYLTKPIDLERFTKRFRAVRGLKKEAILVAFSQTAKRWKAAYQDGEMLMEFDGDVAACRNWLSKTP
jgi:hypothetical protein